MKKAKKKNYKVRSILTKIGGYSLMGASSLGGVAVYTFSPSINGIEDLQTAFQDFQIFEEGMKLNPMIALPILVAFIVFAFVVLRKNKDFFKDKASLGLAIATGILYIVYSIIGVALSACIGLLPALMVHEFVLDPISRNQLARHNLKKELELEEQKEIVREEVRERRRR